MATFPSDSPITLVVKAPNQRVGDQTVECFLDWTVKHLKKHLASVYPSKPTEKNQRIIYSGKLLQDNVILKDVLRQHDDTRQHTVHLVCSCDDTSTSSTSNQNLHSSASTESGSSTSSSRRSSTNGDGVRHRTSPSGGVNYPGYNYQQYGYGNYPMHQQQQYGHQSPAAAGAGGSNPYYMANAQQQAYWMQQMYAQQYAQYMYSTQYSSSSMLNTNVPTGPAAAPAVHQPAMVANQNLAPAPVAAANPGAPAGVPPPPNPAAPANQNMRMNAGVGAAVDDDEQEGGNRDWLDWIYTFCRMGVLLSIVYFYSSINRFLVVISAMVFIYLYQGGWFQLQRGRAGIRDPQGEADGNQPQQAEEAEEQQPLEDETDHNTDDVDGNPEEAGEAEEETTDGGETANEESTTSDQQPEEATIPRPGVLATAWVFISTFFTSLLPMDPANIPAAVN